MTPERTAMKFLSQNRFTLSGRSLSRPIRQAILPIIKLRQSQAYRRLAGEEVIGDGEILQPRQLTYALRNSAGENIIRHI